MPELPHLAMHLRRVGRRRALRTLLIILVWVSFICIRLALGDFGPWDGYYPEWMPDINLLGQLIGWFIIYWVIASQMSLISNEENGRPAEWLSAPVNSRAALWGVLGVTGLSSLVPAGMLVLYLLFDPGLNSPYSLYEAPGIWLAFLRLANFALFAACLHLIATNLAVRRFLPLLLALTATAAHGWANRYVYLVFEKTRGHYYGYGYVNSTPLISDSAATSWLVGCVIITVVLMIALPWLVRLVINTRPALWLRYLILGSVMIIPFVGGLAGFITETVQATQYRSDFNLVSSLGGPWQLPFQAALSCALPGITPLADMAEPYWSFYSDVTNRYICYGLTLEHPLPGIAAAAAFYLGSLWFWFRAALAGLDAVRYPGRRLRRDRGHRPLEEEIHQDDPDPDKGPDDQRLPGVDRIDEEG